MSRLFHDLFFGWSDGADADLTRQLLQKRIEIILSECESLGQQNFAKIGFDCVKVTIILGP